MGRNYAIRNQPAMYFVTLALYRIIEWTLRPVWDSDEGQSFLNAIEEGITSQFTQGIHPDKINLAGMVCPMFTDFWEHKG